MAIADHTPIFGLKSHYRSVQCPNLGVLKGLCWKTAQKRVLEGSKVSQEKKNCWGTPPLQLLDFAQNTPFLAKLDGSKGQGRGPTSNFFFLRYYLTLLEHVFGRFSNVTPSEPLSLDIAHFYNGILSQK